ncbi:MAG: hypothetical protein ACHP7O_01870 [Burkholderiales bacterium]
MSNLASAKAAIEAEIAHAKQGLNHFMSRIEALEKTIAHLVSVDEGVLGARSIAAKPVAKVNAKAVAAKPAEAEKSVKLAKASKSASGGHELPFTGGSYWTDLLTDEPKSAPEILAAAIENLGFTPTKEQSQKLAGRMTFSLNALVKANKIQDSGSGRERRFFKG